MSQISTPDVIGLSSAVVSLTTIFSSIASIGIPIGVQRFLGKSFSENEASTTRGFVQSSIILTSIGIIICSSVFIILQDWLYYTFDINFPLLVVSILIIVSTTFMTLFRSIVISTLQTKLLPLVLILGSIIKIILAIVLVSMSYEALGITIGFAFVPILGTVLYSIMLIKVVGFSRFQSEIAVLKYYRDIFISSIANWIPIIIYTIGTQLGTLLVFGSHGSIAAGVYFIAFSLSMAVTALMSALSTIAFPALSSMKDGRKRFTWRTIKFSLFFSLPLSISILFYSKDILSIFGHEYASGSLTLEVLMISILPTAVTVGIVNLCYAYGNYRQVLLIGLASNIPRTILYFIFVPSLEGIGAAISYSAGAIIGFGFSLWISRKINLTIIWKDVGSIVIIPLLTVFIFYLFDMNFIVEILISLSGSYLLYILLGVINPMDLRDISNILPNSISKPLFRILGKLQNRTKPD
jgi:O-antigen/teichoic acid export membrane protein